MVLIFTIATNGHGSQVMVQILVPIAVTVPVLPFRTITVVSGSMGTKVFGDITTSNGLSIEILSPNQFLGVNSSFEVLMAFYELQPTEVFTG